jgi:hypothetical protein
MLGFRGPAQPSPTLGYALNAGYLYLEVRCLGCDTHQTVALDVVQGLLAGARLCVQEEPLGSPAAPEDFRE